MQFGQFVAVLGKINKIMLLTWNMKRDTYMAYAEILIARRTLMVFKLLLYLSSPYFSSDFAVLFLT